MRCAFEEVLVALLLTLTLTLLRTLTSLPSLLPPPPPLRYQPQSVVVLFVRMQTLPPQCWCW